MLAIKFMYRVSGVALFAYDTAGARFHAPLDAAGVNPSSGAAEKKFA